VRAVVARYPVSNPRVFGSVARGEDDEESDLDLPVDPAGLEEEPERPLGVSVDVAAPGGVAARMADAVRRDARPL